MALYKDLLGHNLEKFAGVTVFDATLYDGEKPLITFDTLTVSNISIEGEQKEIRGGQGANLLISYDYGKNANIEITDALASIYSLKYIWGAQIKHENIEALVRRIFKPENVLEVHGPDNIITGALEDLPNYKEDTFPTLLLIMKDGTQHQVATEKIDGGVDPDYLGIDVEDKYHYLEDIKIEKIDKIIVYYTIITTAIDNNSHVYQLTLTTVDFPKVMRLVGETFFVDSTTGKKIFAQVEIPRFKPNADFELSFEAEGDASVFDFSGVALAEDGELVKIRTLGYENDNEEEETDGDNIGYNPEEDIRVMVTFKDDSDNDIITVSARKGFVINENDYPEVEDLDAWYYDSDRTMLHSESDLIQEDIVLYAELI